MLVVRTDQMAVFQAGADARLLDGLVEHLRAQEIERFAGAGDRELRRFAEAGLVRARALGGSAPDALAIFVGLMALFGDDFDRRSWAARVLEDSAQPPDDRIRALIDAAAGGGAEER